MPLNDNGHQTMELLAKELLAKELLVKELLQGNALKGEVSHIKTITKEAQPEKHARQYVMAHIHLGTSQLQASVKE